MTPEEFRRAGHELVDWIADYRERVVRGEFPVMARTRPGSLRAALPTEPPQSPEDFSAIRRDLDALILPACTHWQDPRFHGYFPSNGLPAAVLGDLVSTGLGQLGLNWQASPALTELEEVTLDWWRQMLGLSERWQGVIQDTASAATFVSLVCARERASNHAAARGGLQAQDRPLMIYVSSQAHSSVEKAALLAGFGRDNLRVIPVDANFDMRPDALAAAVVEDRAAGREPCAIVATCGTTATTAFDPIANIAQIARVEELWLHVDAAMAGSAMILPECRELWDGVESADSVVVNPHKWLGVSFDCSTYFVRDRAIAGARDVHEPELPADRRRCPGEELPRLGHSARSPHARHEAVVRDPRSGRERNCRPGSAAISATRAGWPRRWRARRTGRFSRRCACRPWCCATSHRGLAADAIDAHTQSWARAINESGEAYLTPTLIEGRWAVRVSFGAAATEQEHVVDLWRLMREHAGE